MCSADLRGSCAGQQSDSIQTVKRPEKAKHRRSRASLASQHMEASGQLADLWEDSRASPEGCADSWGRVRRGSWLHDAMRASFLMAMPATCTVHALPLLLLLLLLLPGPAVPGRHGLLLRRMVARSVSVASFIQECGVESQAAFPLSRFTPTPHRYGQGVFLAENHALLPLPHRTMSALLHRAHLASHAALRHSSRPAAIRFASQGHG